jgi:hypothetical protein
MSECGTSSSLLLESTVSAVARGRFSNLMKNIRKMVEENPDSWMTIDQQRMLFERKKESS